jgi:predicted PurR-regulated permease PerM
MATVGEKAIKIMSRASMRRIFFLLLVGGVTLWFFYLIKPLLMPIFWATVLAIVFQPVSRYFCWKTGGRENFAATFTTILITFVVLLPISLVVIAMVDEASDLISRVNSGELDPNIVVTWVEDRIPAIELIAEDYKIDFDQVRDNVKEGISHIGNWIGNQAVIVGQNFLKLAVQFFLTLYLLWFFLRDGHRIKEMAIRALPLGDREERMLFNRFATVSRATIKGTLTVAIIQGTIGGLLFWFCGIHSHFFWGVMMTMLSLLPIGGAALIWGPAAIILAVQGDYVGAIIITSVGALGIGLIDNLLRPLLVGRETKMPDYLVLVTTLGGIASFGLAGFIIGPVVAALFLSVWELMMEEFEENPPLIMKQEEEDMLNSTS